MPVVLSVTVLAGTIGCSSDDTTRDEPAGEPAADEGGSGEGVDEGVPAEANTALAVALLGDEYGRRVEIVRVVAEDDVVAVHARLLADDAGRPVDPPGIAAVEVFRFAPDGTVLERRRVSQLAVEPTPGGRTMFDGGGDPADTDTDTDANKALVRRFYDEVLTQGDPEAIAELVAPDYRQHSPLLGDGSQALADALVASRLPNTVQRLTAQGDLVVAEVTYEPGLAAVDIFRIEGGRIAEHWDVLDTLAPTTDSTAGGG